MSYITRFMCCLGMVLLSYGKNIPTRDSPCLDWIPFKNEKCLHLASKSGTQTKLDADIICKTYAEEFEGDDIPKLVTIKTEEEQKLVQKWLFEELETFDNIWLGANLDKDGVYRWNDGSDLFFANWINETSKTVLVDHDRNCVQMESGEGAYKAGMWVKTSCQRRNAVVCERDQPWSISVLKNMVLNLKLVLENNKEEYEKDISDANKKISQANEEIENLRNNPVPVGFVYVQLPGRELPTILWPQTNWTEISSQYAGLFFRIQGKESAAFGVEQKDHTRRFEYTHYSCNVNNTMYGGVTIPENGDSHYVFTGEDSSAQDCGIMFRLSTGEVRPRNKSVKLWQRIN